MGPPGIRERDVPRPEDLFVGARPRVPASRAQAARLSPLRLLTSLTAPALPAVVYAAFAAVSLSLTSSPTSAQEPEAATATLVGTVRAAEDGRPVAAALVRLPELERQSLTSADGRFLLDDLPAGSYTLEVSLLGFAPSTRTVDLTEGETTRVEIVLAVRPIELPEIEAEVEGGSFLPGFLRRMEAGDGHFLTAGDILERDPARLTDMLRSFPETRVRFNPDNPLIPWALTMLAYESGSARGVAGSSRIECLPALVVDGELVPRDLWSANDVLPREVLAVEVYWNPAQVPEAVREDPRFPIQTPMSPVECGAILVWRKLDATMPDGSRRTR